VNALPSPAVDLIALDIGGANIKAADGLGWTKTEAFAMWRDWQRLVAALTGFITDAPRRVVATMTGEIADCFPSRRAGVEHIVAALTSAAGTASVGIYTTAGRIVSPEEAIRDPLTVAASNWHAVARLAASLAPTGRTLLVDIGSTTIDIIPIQDGRPAPRANDDVGRMASGELVYTGMERTPIAAIVRSLPHRGIRRPVASELFARSQDAWLMLAGLPEDSSCTDTADGGPATREAARIRLARTMLLEPEEFTLDDALVAAERIAVAQARRVTQAVRRVARGMGWEPTGMVFSGHGNLLARRLLVGLPRTLHTIDLQDHLSPAVSRVAPAHAVALIAREMLR
jgi:(4-(4-[2-(gamma-L-glutamylamino)ethyl]phenoxymethyl)furan-2-yl)methanamine synthase